MTPRRRVGFIEPMLLLRTDRLPDDPARWLYELKLDGYRAVAFKASGSNLAAMLKAAQAQRTGASLAPLGRWGDERSPSDDDLVQIMLVAGAGFIPPPVTKSLMRSPAT